MSFGGRNLNDVIIGGQFMRLLVQDLTFGVYVFGLSNYERLLFDVGASTRVRKVSEDLLTVLLVAAGATSLLLLRFGSLTEKVSFRWSRLVVITLLRSGSSIVLNSLWSATRVRSVLCQFQLELLVFLKIGWPLIHRIGRALLLKSLEERLIFTCDLELLLLASLMVKTSGSRPL